MGCQTTKPKTLSVCTWDRNIQRAVKRMSFRVKEMSKMMTLEAKPVIQHTTSEMLYI